MSANRTESEIELDEGAEDDSSVNIEYDIRLFRQT